MKYKISLISLTLASCLAAIALPSLARPNTTRSPITQIPITQSGFRCDTSGDVPTTIYQNRQGNPEPWIKWVSDHFSGAGWSPKARCTEVSSRLETYRKNKKLRYVTLGTVNNQSVICVASQNQGPCEGIVYTLKPEQNGIQALNNLFAWRKGEEGLESNYESVTTIPYIDVGSKLDETNQPAVPEQNTPNPNQPAIPEQNTPDTNKKS